jgi:hypothetical protein
MEMELHGVLNRKAQCGSDAKWRVLLSCIVRIRLGQARRYLGLGMEEVVGSGA